MNQGNTKLIISSGLNSALLTFFSALALACYPSELTGQTKLCTPIPDLFHDWKRSTIGTNATDDALMKYLATKRQAVEQLFDPFTRLFPTNSPDRVTRNERVLWEDSTLLVLADKSPGSPKPKNPPEALAIPKTNANFITDVSAETRQKLAEIAAVVSDAFVYAAGRTCSETSISKIYINPPDSIGVKQLHVHVTPKTPIQANDLDHFFSKVEKEITRIVATQTSKTTQPTQK